MPSLISLQWENCLQIHHLLIAVIACPMVLRLTACNQQQAPVAAETADDAAEMPPKEEGPTAKAPSVYRIGTEFVANLAVNGETSVVTDTIIRKIKRDSRLLDIYEHSAAFSGPRGACHGETHVLWDSTTEN